MSDELRYKNEYSTQSSLDLTDDDSSLNAEPGSTANLNSLGVPVVHIDALSGPLNMDALIGATIDGKYVIEDTLGRGAMAVVYSGKQIATNRPVALKMLSIHTTEGIMRFSREVRNHSQLRHPNIVEFLEFVGAKSGKFFLVMELADGTNLQEVIRTAGRIDSSELIASIMLQLCDALIYAHSCNVVHRDLKSSNIILVRTADGDVEVKVLDFGIAKLAGESSITLSGHAVGSPLYMSPEQCVGKTPTKMSDIYSLGIIAYEIIVGQTPYTKGSIRDILAAHCSPLVKPASINELMPQIPCGKVLDQIILKCLEPDPSKRWHSATDLKEAFEFWHKGFNSAQRPDSLPESMLVQKPLPDDKPKDLQKISLAEQADIQAQIDKEQRQTRLLMKRAVKKQRQTILLGVSLAIILIVIVLILFLKLHH